MGIPLPSYITVSAILIVSIAFSLLFNVLEVSIVLFPSHRSSAIPVKVAVNRQDSVHGRIIFGSSYSYRQLFGTMKDRTNQETLLMSEKDDITSCYSLRTHVMPEELIYIGAPSENTYHFPKLQKPTYNVTFDQVHQILFGKITPSIYDEWQNYFNKNITHGYETHLIETFVNSIINHVTNVSKIPLYFVVEIGSFTGMSAMQMGIVMHKHKLRPFILCIDTWLGDMNMWINKVESIYLGIVNGRPQVFDQFMANIIGHNMTQTILPFSTTSILGARFLHIYQFYPQVIFLDSAHEQGETLIELALFWPLLQPGGILVGDDWDWRTVRCDVKKFAYNRKLKIEIIGGYVWCLKKPIISVN